MPPVLLAVGDSVNWGQGLLWTNKMSTLVAQALQPTLPGLEVVMRAHSGAIIGAGATVGLNRVHGEVPVGYPTILDQIEHYEKDAADVRIVLVNGGINDIDIRIILNPFVPLATLSALTIEHCYDSMRTLLQSAAARFPGPEVPILVTPYYPILSPNSKPFDIPMLLAQQGLALPPWITLTPGPNPIVERCMQFWKESTESLTRAVDDVNAEAGTNRVLLVDPGFTDANAIFAEDPWLFGVSNAAGMPAEDEVIPERRLACNAAIPPHDVLGREQCYRASAGHPNRKGAERYAHAILQALTV